MTIKSLTLDHSQYISYEVYCKVLTQIGEGNTVTSSLIEDAGLFDYLKGSAEKIRDLLSKFGNDLNNLAKERGINIKDLAKAFTDKGLFNLLKAAKFNLGTIIKGLKLASSLIDRGILAVVKKVLDSGMLDKLRSGAIKMDAILKKYPILKALTGVAIAGLLIYMWMSMSFTGNVISDFDLSSAIDALRGHFSLVDLFLSATGLHDVVLTLVGMTTGISFPYLLGSTAMLLAAMAYTVLKKHSPAIAAKLGKGFKLIRLKT